MFEKESEEYADYFWGASPSAQRAIKQAYQQGAEFGFNKTNEWHDLRKDPNALPNNYRYVWTNVGAGYYDDGWWDDFGRLQGVIAWCEPKFEE